MRTKPELECKNLMILMPRLIADRIFRLMYAVTHNNLQGYVILQCYAAATIPPIWRRLPLTTE